MSHTAKELFVSGNFSAAKSNFIQADSASTDPTQSALQRSNAAQCDFELCQIKQVAEYTSWVVWANAHNTKINFVNAKSLAPSQFPSHILDVARCRGDIAMANAYVASLSKRKSSLLLASVSLLYFCMLYAYVQAPPTVLYAIGCNNNQKLQEPVRRWNWVKQDIAFFFTLVAVCVQSEWLVFTLTIGL